jgi:hypothetical protein
LDYKFIELLHCNFAQLDEDLRREAIQFRYNSAKTKLQIMEARLRDVNSLLKLKNPSLLLQLQKSQASHYQQDLAMTTQQASKTRK